MRSANSRLRYGLSGLLFLLAFVAVTVTTRNVLTEPHPGHNDFLSRWEGARSFWIDGLNPYGEEASLNIQIAMYSRPALETEDQVLFAYPMYTAILLAPLVLVNYAWASALIMVIMEVLLILALILLLDLFAWKPGIFTRALLIIAALFVYYPARGLILGQLGLISYVMYAITFWSLKKERDWLAGIAMAIATIKPQLGIFIIPFLLLWGLRSGRRQFVGAFILTMGILAGISFLLVPTWLTDMWTQVTQYTGYAPVGPGEELFENVLGLPVQVRYTFYVILWIPMLYAWYQVLIAGKSERAMWTAMLTLAVTNIASPVIATPHFAVFFIPLIFYLKQLSIRGRAGRRWIPVILIALIVEPWARFILTVDYQTTLESYIMSYPEPILMMILLWFTPHLWWEKDSTLIPGDSEGASTTA